MRVFITGATGFIGNPLVRELIDAGHQVLGMSRSDAGAEALAAAGAEVHRGTLEELDSLRTGAANADAVIHLAFNHDFSKFAENCETDRRAIEAMGEVLAGSNKVFIVTSGTGITESSAPGVPSTEDDPKMKMLPRVSEEAALAFADKGVRVVIVRLPQVHDTRRQGLVSWAIEIAAQKGKAAYIGEGTNRWPAAPVLDTAHLYRLALEKGETAIYHAVAEEGVSMREIAETIGKGMKLPIVSLTPEQAQEYYGWLAMFAGRDMPSSSAKTRKALGWNPSGPSMIEDLSKMDYSTVSA